MNALDNILAQPKVTHDLVQGTPEWDAFRLQHRGASEAAAMLGLSKNVTRTELLHMKHTGLAREFSDWLQNNVLDKGHEVEALARPHVEAAIGEDLYPVTCSRGPLSASCDGLTMDDAVAMEHKQWNDDLAAMVEAGIVPDDHMPQCQQILLVTGAGKVRFVVSDGTPERMVWAEVSPDVAWWERIVAGWEQFDKDLATYSPAPPAEPKPIAHVVGNLPVVLDMRVSGKLVACNIEEFKPAALDYIAAISTTLTTDQDFVDAAADAKFCRDSADKLELSIEQALGQMGDINIAINTVREIAEAFDKKALALEKLVKDEKERRRGEIVAGGVNALREHVASLNERLGTAWMPQAYAAADFGAAVKNKRELSSMENAVATTLANAKIAANAVADTIQFNRDAVRSAADGDAMHLFPDFGQVCVKSREDFANLLTARLDAEQRRKDAERERIRREEQAKAEREAREKLESEQREAAARAAASPPSPAPVAIQPLEATPVVRQEPPVVTDNVRPMPTRAPSSPPALRLGQIGERLGFTVSADFLTSIGFPPAATDKNAKLYYEQDFQRICAALIAHIQSVQQQRQAA